MEQELEGIESGGGEALVEIQTRDAHTVTGMQQVLVNYKLLKWHSI